MIEDYYTDTAVHHQRTGFTGGGDPSFVDVEVRCRVERGMRVYRNDKGQEVLSTMRVLLSQQVQPVDAFTVDGVRFPVGAVFGHSGFDGVDHYEVLL